MFTSRFTPSSVFGALQRARYAILTIAATYLVAILIGISMVHGGVTFALNTRDRIVGQAYQGNNPTINAMQNGQPLVAALVDFGTNLFLGAIPSTLGGLGIVFPYPLVFYRGWVGGIVSVDGNHASRFAQLGEAIYYLVTLILQLIPYSLAGGAGVHLGLAYYHTSSQGKKWHERLRPEILDVSRIYLLVVPLFLIASLWEFLLR